MRTSVFLTISNFIIFLGVLPPKVFSQSINFEWSYGGSLNDGNFDSRTIEKQSGIFITTTSKISTDGDVLDFQGKADVWLFCHDANRNILWQKSIGGTEAEFPTEILWSKFNQVILVGTTNSVNGHFNSQDSLGDAFVLKTDSIGNILWVKNFGGSQLDLFNDIVEDSLGNLYVAGYTESDNGDVSLNKGGLDLWLLKMDSSGNVLWNKTIGGLGDEIFPALYLDLYGNLVLAARSNSYDSTFILSSGSDDAIICKMDTDGNIKWIKRYGGSSYEGFNSITRGVNGGYVLLGFSDSNDGDVGSRKGGGDLWIVETDTSGNIIWNKVYGGSREDGGREIVNNRNNRFGIIGITSSNDGDINNYHFNGTSYQSDLWYLEVDSIGQMLWNRCFGSTWQDYPGGINFLNDQTVLLTGAVSEADGDVSFLHGNNSYRDIWIVNFNTPTNLGYSISPDKQLTIFPNPFYDKLLIRFSEGVSHIERLVSLRDIYGRIVYFESSNLDQLELNLSELPCGIYFLEYKTENTANVSQNLVLLKQ